VTVRAFGDTPRFSEQNLGKLDTNAACLYTGYVLNRWLQIRTQAIVGVAFTSVTAGLAVLFKGSTDPAVAGMAIKYSIEISRTLSFLVRSFTTAEMQAVSVERVHEYVQLEPEASQAETPPRDPPDHWPRDGRVEWINVSLRYRKGLEPALNGVNAVIEPVSTRNGGQHGCRVLSVRKLIACTCWRRDGRLVSAGAQAQVCTITRGLSRLAEICPRCFPREQRSNC
jgi:ABC-type multidrug transport system fused ATPase/permease subunit